MHGCKIVRKDGTEVHGTLWALNQTTWTFQVTDDENVNGGRLIEVPVGECVSAVEYNSRRTAASVGEDEDLLDRARKWGWEPDAGA